MEHSITSPHLYRYASTSLPTNPTKVAGSVDDRDEVESPEDTWSGQESGNEAAAAERKDSQSSDRGLKRKRPVMVSYIAPFQFLRANNFSPSFSLSFSFNRPFGTSFNLRTRGTLTATDVSFVSSGK